MYRWVRRWEITVTWDQAVNSPRGTKKFTTRVDTPRELNDLITAARADRSVTSFPYHSVRELVGEPPRLCNRGHSLGGGSATRAKLEWIQCACGGHLVFLCKWPDCGDRIIEPVPDDDCRRLPSSH